ncbi:hypothetical protein [Shinella sumterensis]|jgi:hypothetical protein|uniref:Uncharacterized protein n=1 Tax=Shinella sumterensis TaxID=1967501 RepID=A0AA50H6R5_9HYPH|nr:hypothetical protein [Shinella sumterensis]WLR98733.1 hypothetical protein Q9313_06845 [Shinella sumterensis]
MSSVINPRQNGHLVATATSHLVVTASILMILYVLAAGWLW